jgi:hypothetical protein
MAAMETPAGHRSCRAGNRQNGLFSHSARTGRRFQTRPGELLPVSKLTLGSQTKGD